jgi:hypothetical protein
MAQRDLGHFAEVCKYGLRNFANSHWTLPDFRRMSLALMSGTGKYVRKYR